MYEKILLDFGVHQTELRYLIKPFIFCMIICVLEKRAGVTSVVS